MCALFGLAFAAPAVALDPQRAVREYLLESWPPERGLPKSSVYALTQSPDGFLWLGSSRVLARFDGVTFRTFDSANTPALGGFEIVGLVPAKEGGLWVAGDGSGLARFHEGRLLSDGRVHKFVRGLWAGQDGTLWVATAGGLSRVRGAEVRTFTKADGLPDNSVRAVVQDRAGHVWAGTTRGLARFDGQRWRTFTEADGLSNERVQALSLDHDGGVLVGTFGGVDHVLGDRVLSFPAPADASVRAVLRDRDGNLWAGTWGRGVARWGTGVWEILDEDTGLSSNLVRALYEDREGSLWIGTAGGGLDRLRDRKLIAYGRKEGLANSVVTAVREDGSGNLWVGTQRGLQQLRAGVFRTVSFPEVPADQPVSVRHIHEDEAGGVWVATNAGLWRWSDGALSRVHPGEPLRSADVAVRDSQGRLWLGSGALKRWDGRELRVIDGPPALVRGVNTIFEDRRGDIWVGTKTGLAQIGPDGVRDRSRGLSHGDVRALHEDASGAIWVATRGGLARIEGDEPARVVGQGQGLADEVLSGIVEDDRGQLWLASEKGVFSVRAQQVLDVMNGRAPAVEPTLFDAFDGIPVQSCPSEAGPVAFRGRDGTLWFATLRGLVASPPQRPPRPRPPMPVHIEAVVAGGLPQAISAGRPLAMPRGPGTVEIAYTAPSLLVPERVRFRYRLEPLESTWVEAGARRSAHYGHLPPGRYRFRVIARDSDGVWGDQGAALDLHIGLSWAWAYWAAGAVAAVVVALGLHRLRGRRPAVAPAAG